MSQIPHFGRRLAAGAASAWSCLFCRRVGAQWQSAAFDVKQTSAVAGTTRITARQSHGKVRFFSQSTPKRAQAPQNKRQPRGYAAPSMEQMYEIYRKRNQTVVYYTISIILGTVAFSYGSVPMYKMICQTTGWGGQPVRAHGTASSSSSPEDLASRLEPVRDAKRIRVTFTASVSNVLPWKFVPQQREVRVLPGETALAFYTATNNSDKDIIGVATYSVTPAQVAPYFSKIQCFCFEEQRLAAGETVDMPVFFYLDPDLLKDVNMKGVETVTLNYTFFKARYDDNGRIRGIPGPLPEVN